MDEASKVGVDGTMSGIPTALGLAQPCCLWDRVAWSVADKNGDRFAQCAALSCFDDTLFDEFGRLFDGASEEAHYAWGRRHDG